MYLFILYSSLLLYIMQKLQYTFIFIIFTISLFAQKEYSTGLSWDDKTYNRLPRVSFYQGTKFDKLPLKVDLEKFCPPPGNQGEMNSCVGYAVGYGAMTIQRAIKGNWTDKDKILEEANSALFIYNQIEKRHCNENIELHDAMELIESQGNCLFNNFDNGDCNKQPTETDRQQALQYLPYSYYTLFLSVEEPAKKILQVKKALAKNKAVIVGMELQRNFFELTKGKSWHSNIGDTSLVGGHAMVVVGYNQFKRAFRVLNSWGKDWGDNGFIWIDFDDFGKFCRYAYQINYEEDDKPSVIYYDKQDEPNSEKFATDAYLAGKLQLKYLDDKKADFSLTNVGWNESNYTLQKKNWTIGQMFQLDINVNANAYVYIFSIDPVNKLTLHFSTNESEFNSMSLDEFTMSEDEATNEFVNQGFTEGQTMTLPGKDSAYTLSNKGKDHMVILYSTESLSLEIENIMQTLRYSKENLNETLYSNFSHLIIDPEYIQYSYTDIEFSASENPAGYVVPIIIEIKAK